ncbi:MAG: DNA recombination protein RmuC, partial [Endozoicomonas sp.]
AGRAALKQQLETMYQLNQKMTDEAQNLAKALKGDKKLQGNWGEIQVETILESSGLIKGQEYEREANFKDDEGQNKRPDFIVRLPEGKHLIIDSKVSLVDYIAYANAENDSDRDIAMSKHIQSIRNHIKNLNQKDYPSLPEIKTPDFVFMFMPIEPAFITAFQYDQQLFNEAFEKRIVVVTPSTLLATLRTVANLWTIERQNANARKLADKGRQVYDKLRIFVEKMEKLDSQLDNARSTYDEAMSTLKHGRGNLISQADQFLALGVRVKKELPNKTLETADLDPGESDALIEQDSILKPSELQEKSTTDDAQYLETEAFSGVEHNASEENPANHSEVVSDPVTKHINSIQEVPPEKPDVMNIIVSEDKIDNTEALSAESDSRSDSFTEDKGELLERALENICEQESQVTKTTQEKPVDHEEHANAPKQSVLPNFADLETRLEVLNTELPSLEDELARLEREYPETASRFSEDNYRSEGS